MWLTLHLSTSQIHVSIPQILCVLPISPYLPFHFPLSSSLTYFNTIICVTSHSPSPLIFLQRFHNALHYASENGHTEIVKALITVPGIDVNLLVGLVSTRILTSPILCSSCVYTYPDLPPNPRNDVLAPLIFGSIRAFIFLPSLCIITLFSS